MDIISVLSKAIPRSWNVRILIADPALISLFFCFFPKIYILSLLITFSLMSVISALKQREVHGSLREAFFLFPCMSYVT